MNFTFSKHARTRVERIGREGQPVVVVDEAAAAPDALVEDAAGRPFAPIGPYYPGVRALAPAAVSETLREAVQGLIREHFGLECGAWADNCCYSLVTTPPAALQPIQRLPHVDGLEHHRIAVLLYLGRPEQGGTSFYRQAGTGFETVSPERYPRYKQTLEASVRAHGLPALAYVGDGAPHFERIASIPAAFNRLILYRSFCLHSGSIDNEAPLTADPRTGRLTLNAFLKSA